MHARARACVCVDRAISVIKDGQCSGYLARPQTSWVSAGSVGLVSVRCDWVTCSTLPDPRRQGVSAGISQPDVSQM